jgi:putative glutamine amidotransferase
MRRPLIGITCGTRHENGKTYYASSPSYIKAVEHAGGAPVLIIPTDNLDVLRTIYERLDGVLIAGGGDVDPAEYGMDSGGMVEEVDKERDITELNVTRWAAEDDKPLLGICRGCQVANVALGGTLYRDIQAEYPTKNGVDHDMWGKAPRHHIAHTVAVKPESKLATAVGEQVSQVNSMHHQALRDIPPQLTVTATSPDGLIEGIEIPDARFFVGVQWHPEELTEYSDSMRRLFKTFVDASSRK